MVTSHIGYKVVRKIGNMLISATSTGLPITYIPGRWVVPDADIYRIGGPLCVFDGEYRARDYAEVLLDILSGSFEIWKCKYIPSKLEIAYVMRERYLEYLSDFTSFDVSRLLNIRECTKIYRRLIKIPLGTKFARRVKLLEKVK